MCRKVRRVRAWKVVAWRMYKKFYGTRCAKCSQPVKPEDAAVYTMDGLDELILTHRKCEP